MARRIFDVDTKQGWLRVEALAPASGLLIVAAGRRHQRILDRAQVDELAAALEAWRAEQDDAGSSS